MKYLIYSCGGTGRVIAWILTHWDGAQHQPELKFIDDGPDHLNETVNGVPVITHAEAVAGYGDPSLLDAAPLLRFECSD